MEPALFSPALLFGQRESDEETPATSTSSSDFVERKHDFPGMALTIREFTFHQVNANLLWPGTLSFAKWLVEHQGLLKDRRALEIGSGTGALAIFLRKAFAMDITTSDFDDEDIEENIAYNCKANGVTKLQHIRHTWGDTFPVESPDWDLILASDILLYVKQYANLIKSLLALLQNSATRSDSTYNSDITCMKEERTCKLHDPFTDVKLEVDTWNADLNLLACKPLPKPCFLMGWRRRLPKDDEMLFFNGCKENGLFVRHLGSRVYCIF